MTLRRPPPRDLPFYLVLGAMLVLGVYLRLHDCQGPSAMRWDEHHYLNVAHAYLTRTYATDDHPPFGKLIITGALRLVGDTPFGWRFASLVFGFANIGLSAWVAHVVWTAKSDGKYGGGPLTQSDTITVNAARTITGVTVGYT